MQLLTFWVTWVQHSTCTLSGCLYGEFSYLHIQQAQQHNLKFCFCNICYPFSSVFGFYQLIKKIWFDANQLVANLLTCWLMSVG